MHIIIIIFLKSDCHTYTLDVYNFYWEVKVELNIFALCFEQRYYFSA